MYREPPEVSENTLFATCKHLSWMYEDDLRKVEQNNVLRLSSHTASPREAFDAAKMVQKCARERMGRQARDIRREITERRKQLRRLTPRR